MLYSYLLPGSKLSGAVAVELDVVLRGAEFQAVGVELGAEEVSGASGVGQQVMDGDLGGEVFVGIVGEIFDQRISQGGSCLPGRAGRWRRR